MAWSDTESGLQTCSPYKQTLIAARHHLGTSRKRRTHPNVPPPPSLQSSQGSGRSLAPRTLPSVRTQSTQRR